MLPSLRFSDDGAERQYIEILRARYEKDGFTFQAEPDLDQLPDFLAGYRPDAIAHKPRQNVAIDVRRGSGPSEPPLPAIRRLFDGHPDWHLHIAVTANDPLRTIAIRRADPAEIRAHDAEIRALHAAGHCRAAFVMAWALMEAALRLIRDEAASANPAGTVVQALAMNGLIELETERSLQALVALRNRIVHGDLAVEPTADELGLVLAAVESTLSAETSYP